MHNKIGLLALIFLLIFFSCSKDSLLPTDEGTHLKNPIITNRIQDSQIEPLGNKMPLSVQEIDEIIIAQANSGELPHWQDVNDYTLWSAVAHSQSVVTIGYKPARVSSIKEALISGEFKTSEWIQARNRVLNQILNSLNKNSSKELTESDIEAFPELDLPFIFVKISDYTLLAELRRSENVSSVEPMAYPFGTETTIANKINLTPGCGDQSISPNTSSLFSTSSSAKYSWHLARMNIPLAWKATMPNNSNQTVNGQGIEIGLIDSGVDLNQNLLNAGFNNGVPGKTLSKINLVIGSSNDDECGHGTRMAGLIAGPRTNIYTGVAYASSLRSFKAINSITGVLIDPSEVMGVAISLLSIIQSPARIVSMSIGMLPNNSLLESILIMVRANDRLIFCAAGTSPKFLGKEIVVFPANLPVTIAVTGTKSNSSQACTTCHYGPAVDYSVVVEKETSSQPNSITLGRDNIANQYNESTGASCATATLAGATALIWSVNPNMNALAVENILFAASERINIGRDNEFGWGSVDVAAAVEMAGASLPVPLQASIGGPTTINLSATYTYYANVPNATAPLIRKWYLNGQYISSGSSAQIPFIANQTPLSSVITLEVEEVGGDNRTVLATKGVAFLAGSLGTNSESE